MKTIDNYEAKIWLGLQEGYSGNYFPEEDVIETIKQWCSERGQCVNISQTKFVYVNNEENGLVIGFINYPRYPFSEGEIRKRAIELGKILMKKYAQFRVSITFYPCVPCGTLMLESSDE
jgi:hypothetical protein